MYQSCSLSPILFALFIDKLYSTLYTGNSRGTQLCPNLVEIYMLMFADDIAFISDTDTDLGLQKQLYILNEFEGKVH